jgi:chemotaxis protein CheX
MSEITGEQIVTVVSRATSEVFQTMLAMDMRIGEPREETINHPLTDGVVALVGVGGAWAGSGRISCSATLACKLAGAMLMQSFDHVNEDVLDAMSEIANMIIGNVKTTFEDQLGTLVLSLPTVVYGRNYKTRCSGVRKWTVIPVDCGGEVMEVCFFLVKNQTLPQHGTPTPAAREQEVYV